MTKEDAIAVLAIELQSAADVIYDNDRAGSAGSKATLVGLIQSDAVSEFVDRRIEASVHDNEKLIVLMNEIAVSFNAAVTKIQRDNNLFKEFITDDFIKRSADGSESWVSLDTLEGPINEGSLVTLLEHMYDQIHRLREGLNKLKYIVKEMSLSTPIKGDREEAKTNLKELMVEVLKELREEQLKAVKPTDDEPF